MDQDEGTDASLPSSSLYLIGGDDECVHDTHFVGVDMASNRYYRCERCEGAIVAAGDGQYEAPEPDSTQGADRDALEMLSRTSRAPDRSGDSLVARLRSFIGRMR